MSRNRTGQTVRSKASVNGPDSGGPSGQCGRSGSCELHDRPPAVVVSAVAPRRAPSMSDTVWGSGGPWAGQSMPRPLAATTDGNSVTAGGLIPPQPVDRRRHMFRPVISRRLPVDAGCVRLAERASIPVGYGGKPEPEASRPMAHAAKAASARSYHGQRIRQLPPRNSSQVNHR